MDSFALSQETTEMRTINRANAVDYANKNWFQACSTNGVVWTRNTPIDVAKETRKLKLDPNEWVGRFLFYDSGAAISEGLFLVPAAEATPSILKSREFLSRNFPNKRFLCSWSDRAKESTEGQTPPFTGLNDCTHFTSSCLVAGGLQVANLMAGTFVGMLRADSDVKTLCLTVHKDLARRMINKGPFTAGDVIAFSDDTMFHHAILYLGHRKVAAHTHVNHPDGPEFNKTTDPDGRINTWEISANSSHPKVTLLHFTQGDLDPGHSAWVHGWWTFTWRGADYFYHFDKDGRVWWTQTRPGPAMPPPADLSRHGYWFARHHHRIDMCWTRTGTFEHVQRTDPSHVVGTSNDEPLEGTRFWTS